MGKKSKTLLFACSMLLGVLSLTACNVSNIVSTTEQGTTTNTTTSSQNNTTASTNNTTVPSTTTTATTSNTLVPSSSTTNNTTPSTNVTPTTSKGDTTTDVNPTTSSDSSQITPTTSSSDATTQLNPTTSSQVTPTTSTEDTPTSTTTSEEPKFVDIAILIGGVEFLPGYNIDYNYGDNYLDGLTVNLLKEDGTTVEVNDYNMETNVTSESKAGTYSLTISYGNFEPLSFTVIINPIDVQIESFNIPNKIYNGEPCDVSYTLSKDVPANITFKAKGADDSTYTENAPVNCGEYVGKISIDNGTNEPVEATCEFIIVEKIVVAPTSFSETLVFQTFSTGSEQVLSIPGIDMNLVDIYEEVNDEYVLVDELKNTSGIKKFKIKTKNDNYLLSHKDILSHELEYTWVILDGSMITAVHYNNEEMSFDDFLAIGTYKPYSCSFETTAGYTAYIADYNLNPVSQLSHTSNIYLVIKQGELIIYIEKLNVVSAVIDAVNINGETYTLGNDNITHLLKSTDENVTINFVNATTNCKYALDNRLDKNDITGPLVLSKDEHLIEIYERINENSYMSISKIYIVKEDPIKSIDAIKYDFRNDRIFTQHIEQNSYGYYNVNSDGDFLIGFNVELNEEYSDCKVSVVYNNELLDYTSFLQEIYYNSGQVANSISILVYRNDKIIKEVEINVDSSYIGLDGKVKNGVSNRGVVESIILVDNSDKKVDFKLAGNNPGGKILVNDTENCTKVYESEGIYREKITYIKELLGKEYKTEFYCNVIVSEDSKEFGKLSAYYYTDADAWKSYTSISDYNGDYNCFTGAFTLYSVNSFDPTTINVSKEGCSLTSAVLVNDDELGITYIIATINDGASDHVLYLFVPTDLTLGFGLNVENNSIGYEKSVLGQEYIEFDENNTATIAQASKGDNINIWFESALNVLITEPSGKTKNYVSVSEIYDYVINEIGTYTIKVTNRKNESKEYFVKVENIVDIVDLNIGDDTYRLIDSKKGDFVVDSMNMTLIAYVGVASESLIEDGKIEISIGGQIADALYTDVDLTNKINGTAKLDVKVDPDGVKYAMIYFESYGSVATVVISFKDKVISPVRISVGEDIYDLGNDENPGDLVSLPFGEFMLINDFSDDIYLLGTNVYDDFSYSLVLIPQFAFDDEILNTTLGYLGEIGLLYKVFDANTLKQKIDSPLSLVTYGYILPEGAQEDDYLSKYISSSNDMFMLIKNSYVLNTTIGENNYYAGVYIDGMMNLFSQKISFETNANDFETNSNGAYTELYFYIGEDEIANIKSNSYSMSIKSGYSLSGTLYTDSTLETVILPRKSFIVDPDDLYYYHFNFDVKEDLDGTKYIEFYYNISVDNIGTCKVKYIFADENIYN